MDNGKVKTREDVAVKGRPHSTYSANFLCPECEKSYTDHKSVKVTYYKLPTPDTLVGMTPKDGAIEVHCPCGTIFWNHIPLDGYVAARDTIVSPTAPKTKTGDGRMRATGVGQPCDISECKYCHPSHKNIPSCCFGGWNAGLGCYMDNTENVDNLIETMVGARMLRDEIKFRK